MVRVIATADLSDASQYYGDADGWPFEHEDLPKKVPLPKPKVNVPTPDPPRKVQGGKSILKKGSR